MEQGYLAIILHAHLPFVKHPEDENALEENWLREALIGSYIPLLMMLDDLINDGVDFRLTFSLTPTLAFMLMDPLLDKRFEKSLERSLELGRQEIKRTKTNPHFHALAYMYRQNLLNIQKAYKNRYKNNLIEAFRQLLETGKIDILATAATHAYLPLLLADPGAVRAQVHIGIETYKTLFGRDPQGFWLPECGYSPGIDDILSECGIRYAVLETHGITRADETPPYGVYAPIQCNASNVYMFGRDPETSKQVWSATEGFPGDSDYREFYRDIGYDLALDYLKPFIHPEGIRSDTGFKYYRVTDKHGDKAVYNPERATQKTELHARRFIQGRQNRMRSLSATMGQKPIFVAPYDAELFGHWWYEGPQWLNNVIRMADGQQQKLKLVTLSEYLDEYPAHRSATPCASSWGEKGYHETWLNEKNDWIYPQLHKGAITMETLARQFDQVQGVVGRALRQCARELLLAQASDWAFMMHTGNMAEYGRKRAVGHVDRLHHLALAVQHNTIDETRLNEIECQDNIFPHIDHRVYGHLSAGPMC